MTALALALGLLGTILGIATLTLSIYNLVLLKSRPAEGFRREVTTPYNSNEAIRGFMSGEPDGPTAINDNMGEVYDPEDEFGTIDEMGI